MKPTQRLILITTIALVAGLTVFRGALFSVITAVLHREGSSHGLFIPFLTMYFVWINREVLRKTAYGKDLLGIVLITMGLLPLVMPVGSYHIAFIGYVVFLNGLILLMMGRSFFKILAFPMFFLIVMTPISGKVYYDFADVMRHITFSGALSVISIFDVTHYRSGWFLYLPNATLEVALSCSGIRYLISYFVFGLAYAYLMKTTAFARLITVAATIPISILASIFRLTAIFLATYYISPTMAEPRPHKLISWVVFFAILILCIVLDQYVQKRKMKEDRR